MNEPTSARARNAQRAQWAAQICYRFSYHPEQCGRTDATPEEIESDDIGDALCDIMHLCHALREKYSDAPDFDEMLYLARRSFDSDISDVFCEENPLPKDDDEAPDCDGPDWKNVED